MSKLENQWIDIFRAGTFPDKAVTFTGSDVQQIVDNYDPAQYEAPAVLGHPKDDHPAYAWFSELRRQGDTLQGKMRQVVPAFEQAVEDGRFKNRSVKVLKDATKGWMLRHVGFLGAMLPEVKGLEPIKFGTEDAQAIELEFSEETDVTATEQQTFNERMKSFFEGLFGAKAAEPKTFSEADVKRIATEASAAAVAAAIAPFEVKFSEREKSLSTVEQQRAADASIARVKAKGAWVPAFDKMGVPQVFVELAKQGSVMIEFGEGATKTKSTPLEAFTLFMEGLKQIVPSVEVYTGKTRSAPPAGKIAHINEAAFAAADPNSILFAEEIQKLMGEKQIDYGTAMAQVAAEHPELTRPGGASAGVV